MNTPNPNLAKLYSAGVSIWLDDLSRSLIHDGELASLISNYSITGVTTNPAIFQQALSKGNAYDEQISELASRGSEVDSVIRTVTTDDVRAACDLFLPVYEKTGGENGRVSIEVDPRLAKDTQQTIVQAAELWKIVDRPNVLIKIPATVEGLPAITAVIAEGISVNVTLIFSIERYEKVIQAYLEGLRQAHKQGRDLSAIHSVASFFISRVDTEIDNRLEKAGKAESLAGKAGLANARLAYKLYQDYFESPQFDELKALKAHPQRPLWASTGVKNPAYPDTLYVANLVAPHTVNTIPGKTLEAFADHGEVKSDSIIGLAGESQAVFDELAAAGIDLPDVFSVLETEGVDKFITAWKELLEATDEKLAQLRK